jgi:hypothetical protein
MRFIKGHALVGLWHGRITAQYAQRFDRPRHVSGIPFMALLAVCCRRSSRSPSDSLVATSPRLGASSTSEHKRSKPKAAKVAETVVPIKSTSTRSVEARPRVASAGRSAPAIYVQDPVADRPRHKERTTESERASRYTMLSRRQSFDDGDVNPSLPIGSLTFPVVHAILDNMLLDINRLDLKYSRTVTPA